MIPPMPLHEWIRLWLQLRLQIAYIYRPSHHCRNLMDRIPQLQHSEHPYELRFQ